MKNRLQIILIFSLIIFSFSELFAQKNGSYMGNRVLFNFGTELSPAWSKPNFFKNSEHWRKYYSFNYVISPGIEIIAHKRGTVGAVYHYCTSRFDYKYDDGNAYWYENRLTAVGDLTSHGFGVFYKQYFGNYSRAPFGAFIKFQFDGFFYKAQCPLPYPEVVTGKMFGLKIAIGHDFLFFDRLKVSTAFSIGTPLSNWSGLLRSSKFFGIGLDRGASVNDYIDSRIFGLYFFGCEMNIGLLAF
ncbi:MAG: hypothetical protein LBV46_00145 [Bacteroidales bacterium]|jgi:hypothetical protein|nr:hypothetical protein [Bacteroidales bacterium]